MDAGSKRFNATQSYLNMTRPSVLFRVDASAEMGMGHLMRCRAIAEAVVDCGGEAFFAMVSPMPIIVDILADIPAQCIRLPGPGNSQAELKGLIHWIQQNKPRITVLDGYHFSDAYHCAVAHEGALAVLWDAADRQAVPTDLIIDASPNAPIQTYVQISPSARLLTGPSHALIRRDIRQAAIASWVPLAQRTKVLLNFGGSDPLNLSMTVLPELAIRLPLGVDISVLAGAAYRHLPALKALAQRLSQQIDINVYFHPPSVVPIFCASGLVVSAGGGTIGELVALSLPALSVIVAKNQVTANEDGPYPCIDGRLPNAAPLIAEHAAALWKDLPRREHMVQNLRGLVDGKGALRVAQALLSTRFSERLES